MYGLVSSSTHLRDIPEHLALSRAQPGFSSANACWASPKPKIARPRSARPRGIRDDFMMSLSSAVRVCAAMTVSNRVDEKIRSAKAKGRGWPLISGLPEISVIDAQLGQARLACDATRGRSKRPILRDALASRVLA